MHLPHDPDEFTLPISRCPAAFFRQRTKPVLPDERRAHRKLVEERGLGQDPPDASKSDVPKR